MCTKPGKPSTRAQSTILKSMMTAKLTAQRSRPLKPNRQNGLSRCQKCCACSWIDLITRTTIWWSTSIRLRLRRRSTLIDSCLKTSKRVRKYNRMFLNWESKLNIWSSPFMNSSSLEDLSMMLSKCLVSWANSLLIRVKSARTGSKWRVYKAIILWITS